MSGFSFSPPSSSSSFSAPQFSEFRFGVAASASAPSFGFGSSNSTASSASAAAIAASSSPFGAASTGSAILSWPSSSISGSITTKTLFGSASSSSVSTTFFGSSSSGLVSTPLFGSPSSCSVSTSTIASPFSSNLFGSSASAAPSFPNLFGASSLPFSAATTPAFSFPATSSFPKGSGSSVSNAGSSSSSFSIRTPASSGFENVASTTASASSAATDSSTPAAKSPSIGFGTASSPAATTTSSSASTTIDPAALSPVSPAFGANSSSSSAASTATATTASSATTVSFPSFNTTNTDASKTSAAASLEQPQCTVVAPLFGPPFPIDGNCSAGSAMFLKVALGAGEEEVEGVEEVNADCGQGRDSLEKQLIISVAEQEAVVTGLRTDQEESKKVMKVEVSSVQESVASTMISSTSFVPVEAKTNPSVVSISADSMSKVIPAEDILVTTNAPKAELNGTSSAKVTYPGKEDQLGQEDAPICVEMEVDGKFGVTSTVIAGDEASAHDAKSQTFCISAPFIYVNGFCISAQNGQIVKQIFDKYGDITKGSRIKSVAAKSGFLELVADAVQRLCNHTMKTLGLDELRFIEQHTSDALAVGFHVNWLQQRVEKIIAASDYYLHLMELDELAKQIDDAKKSLMEMELRQMICMKEVAAIKGEMEENGFGGSKLGAGLL